MIEFAEATDQVVERTPTRARRLSKTEEAPKTGRRIQN